MPRKPGRRLVPLTSLAGDVRIRWLEARTGYNQRRENEGVNWVSCNPGIKGVEKPKTTVLTVTNPGTSFAQVVPAKFAKFTKPC